METTIGVVLVVSGGHYIEIYTPQDSYREGVVNLWDYANNQLLMEPTLSNVLREVMSTLREYFEDFNIQRLEILEAEITELVEPDALERMELDVGDSAIAD